MIPSIYRYLICCRKKQIALLILLAVLASALLSCGGRGEDPAANTTDPAIETTADRPAPAEPTALPEQTPAVAARHELSRTAEGVTVVGVRHTSADRGIPCDWSGSGVELTVAHEGGDIRFNLTSTAPCLFRAYVDGAVWNFAENEPYCTVFRTGRLTLADVAPGTHTVRIVKVTDVSLARATVTSVDFEGSILTPAPSGSEKPYIEFAGDGATTGFGLIGNSTAGDYANEDITLSYAGLLAEKYGADHAMTVHPNAALVAGETKISALYPAADGFARKADVVIVNVGANDLAAGVSAGDFETAYRAFLETVREKNGADCRIVCVYGVAGTAFDDAVQSTVAALGGDAAGYYSVRVPASTNPNAPTAQLHRLYAAILESVLNSFFHIESKGLTFAGVGDGDIDFIEFPF